MKSSISFLRQCLVTKNDLDDFFTVLDNLKESLYDTKRDPAAVLKSAPIDMAKAIAESFKEEKIDINNKQSVVAHLEKIREYIQTIPVIQITVALRPTYSLIDSIKRWIDANVDKFLLLDIRVDNDLIGGAVIAYEGKYKDFSLREDMESYFKRT